MQRVSWCDLGNHFFQLAGDTTPENHQVKQEGLYIFDSKKLISCPQCLFEARQRGHIRERRESVPEEEEPASVD